MVAPEILPSQTTRRGREALRRRYMFADLGAFTVPKRGVDVLRPGGGALESAFSAGSSGIARP